MADHTLSIPDREDHGRPDRLRITDGHAADGQAGNRQPQPGRHREFVANCDAERERREILAVRLRQALEGISCARISQRTGWSAETVRRYLQGKASPPATMLMILAERLRISPEFLLLGTGPARFEDGTTEPRTVPSRQIIDALYFLIAQQQMDPEDPPRREQFGRQNGAGALRSRPAPRVSPGA